MHLALAIPALVLRLLLTRRLRVAGGGSASTAAHIAAGADCDADMSLSERALLPLSQVPDTSLRRCRMLLPA